MSSVGRSRRRHALFALLALVFLAGCVDYPPAWSVCLTCEEGIEAAAEDGPNVTVTGSELLIDVRENGTGRWTVRSELAGPGVESLRSDPARVDRFAGKAVTDSVGDLAPTNAIHDGDVHDISARMDGRAIVVAFVVDDMARRGVDGVLLVDYFNTRGEPPSRWGLGTDRVVLSGPAGTVVTNEPATGTLSDGGNAVVWADRRRGVRGDTYVAFGPDETTTTRLATGLTVGRATAEWVVPEVLRLGWLYAVLALGVAISIVRYTSSRTSTWVADPVGALREHGLTAPPVEYVAVPLSLIPVAVAIVADAGGVTYVLADGLLVWPPVVPVALFGLLGYSVGRHRRLTRSLVVAIGGSPFVVAATLAVAPPVNAPYTNLGELGIGVSVLTTIAVGPVLFLLVRWWRPTE